MHSAANIPSILDALKTHVEIPRGYPMALLAVEELELVCPQWS